MTLSPPIAYSWPTFLAPQWGWLGLLAVPIILLYVLRQKRPDTPISSTILWTKALSDMRASTPWQRLRRNLQLLLQLLILTAIVLTLMRPVVQAKATQAMASVIVIDATASMQTLDGSAPGSTVSRFERACEETRKLVNALRPGDKLNIIVDGGGMTQNSSGFLDSKSELLRFVSGLRPSDATSDLSESLLLAATSLRAIGGAGTDAATGEQKEAIAAGRIYLMSDGAGVALPPIFRDLPLTFVTCGTGNQNVGITRLAVRSLKEPRTYEVFAEVFNASDEAHDVNVGLAFGKADNFTQARKVSVPAHDARPVTFEKVVADPGPFYVALGEKNDDLPADNVAYGVIAPPQKIRVTLVTQGSTPLDHLMEDFLRTPGHVSELEVRVTPIGSYRPEMQADLFIFAGVVPPGDKLPRGDLLFIRPLSSVAGFAARGSVANPQALRWMREAPELSSVEVGELRIFQAIQIDRDPGATELISTTNGPLLAFRDAGASRRYALAFSPTAPDSNWWQYPSFLILMENMVAQTKARHFIGTPQIIRAGSPARISDVTAEATVETPEGVRPLAKYVREDVAEFPETDRAGIYTVRSGEKTAIFAVNVLSTVESDVRTRSLEKPGGGNVEGARSVAAVNREIWQFVAAAGLVLLLLEWIVYHRRLA